MLFFNNFIKDEKNLKIALKQIFGIGFKKGSAICFFLGISEKMKIKFLSLKLKQKIFHYLENYLIIGLDLKKVAIRNKEVQIIKKIYKGIRSKYNLPCRGQRTRTNAKTNKLLSW